MNNIQDRNRAEAHTSAPQNTRVWPVLLIGFLLGMGWLIFSLNSGPDEKPGHSSTPSAAHCNIQTGPCTRALSGGTVMLDIHPKPVRAMRDLRFTVTIDGLRLTKNPHIDLDMPAMTMGFNRVYLEPAGPGLYAGDGVIVRCPTGISTWEAVVVLPGLGEVEYTFDVRY
ncbi:MAG: hypothetical protein ACOC3W_08885 [Thermodesulfobacteriota bacterium]